jgi:class 3 adenylate cyclase
VRTCWLLRRRRAKVSRSLWMACVDVDEPSGRAFHSRTAGKDVGRRGIYAVWRMFAPDGDLMLVSMTAVDPDAGTPPLSWSDVGVNELVTTGTVTLLLADVQGSTRLWDTEPDQMATAVATLDATLAQLVAEFRGVRPLEQGEGDSFVIAFTRASDAIACALALQNAPLAPIRLCIGIHTGEVQLRDDANYVGPTINRTARLPDLALAVRAHVAITCEECEEAEHDACGVGRRCRGSRRGADPVCVGDSGAARRPDRQPPGSGASLRSLRRGSAADRRRAISDVPSRPAGRCHGRARYAGAE